MLLLEGFHCVKEWVGLNRRLTTVGKQGCRESVCKAELAAWVHQSLCSPKPGQNNRARRRAAQDG